MAHLRQPPHASLAYLAGPSTPAYGDCQTEIVEDTAGKTGFSELAGAHPEPSGYDPPLSSGGLDNAQLVVLKLTPERYHQLKRPPICPTDRCAQRCQTTSQAGPRELAPGHQRPQLFATRRASSSYCQMAYANPSAR